MNQIRRASEVPNVSLALYHEPKLGAFNICDSAESKYGTIPQL